MAEMSDEFITISEADARGYGSRATINRYVKKDQVRSYMSGRTRLVSANDLKRIAAMRNDGVRREMDLGPTFDAAAKTCMDVLNELSNEDVRDAQFGLDPKTSNTNRIQRGVSRFFKQAFSTRADEILRDRTAAGATYEASRNNERQFGD